MLNYTGFICFALAYAILALDEITGARHRSEKIGKVISSTAVVLCLTFLVTYFASLFFTNHASFFGTPMAALLLAALPIVSNIGRGIQKSSSARLTCYWIVLFVSVVAIVVRIIGL